MPGALAPLRIKVIPQCHMALEDIQAQARTCDGLPRLAPRPPHGGKLAIVGGGASTAAHLGELKSWDGEIWAINSTAKWLLERGIDCTFICIDPGPAERFSPAGKRALLATCCDPSLRAMFEKVDLFDLCDTHPEGVRGGTTCASRAMALAIRQGFFDVTLYGCDSSFLPGRDHVDRHEEWPEQVVIRAGGVDYLTILEWQMQAECISPLIRLAPNVFKNRSGGLLQAMVDHDDWEVVAVSAALKEAMEALNGETIFTEPLGLCPST